MKRNTLDFQGHTVKGKTAAWTWAWWQGSYSTAVGHPQNVGTALSTPRSREPWKWAMAWAGCGGEGLWSGFSLGELLPLALWMEAGGWCPQGGSDQKPLSLPAWACPQFATCCILQSSKTLEEGKRTGKKTKKTRVGAGQGHQECSELLQSSHAGITHSSEF